jgi:hypothetical protein
VLTDTKVQILTPEELLQCINGSFLASHVNSNQTNGTICRSTISFAVWNFHSQGTQFTTQFTCFISTKVQILTPEELRAGAQVLVAPLLDPLPPPRFLTPFNALLGPIVVDQSRYAETECPKRANRSIEQFWASGCLEGATGAGIYI